MLHFVLAALLSGIVSAAALAAPPVEGSAADLIETPDQILAAAIRQSTGAPARADIGDQATLRLAEGLMLIPRDPAARLLAVTKKPVPPDFQALLVGSEGMEAPGLIRFVPAGFIDSNAALAWSPNDILASLNDTMERGNPQRVERGLPELEARRWVLPPHYDPETRQISWAALILPKSAPRESDGEVTYQAIGFGRQGYMQITVVSSMQKADQIGHMLEAFLGGLVFRPGKIYDDALPTDRTAPAGLPGAMGIDAFRKWRAPGNFLASDTVVPVAGAIVATIGALSLIIYIRRQQRRQARRG